MSELAYVPLYLRDVNIKTTQIQYRQKTGELLQLARGVAIGNPLVLAPGLAAEKAAEAINATLRRFALRIAAWRHPEGVIEWVGAATGLPDDDRVLRICATSREGELVLGEELVSQLPEAVARHVEPVRLIWRRERRTRHRMQKGRDFVRGLIDDGFAMVPGTERFLKDPVSGWDQMTVARTTPRRTLLDLIRYEGEPGTRHDREVFRALAREARVPVGGARLPQRLRAALVSLREEFPDMPPGVLEVLGDRVLSQLDVRPAAMGGEKARFVLRWHGRPVGQLIHRHDDKWMFYYEPGWRLKLWSEPPGEMFPPFLSSLFPEQRKFNPGERADFLRRYSRLMGNLVITEASSPPPDEPEDRIEQSLDGMADDGVLFQGRLQGVPAYDIGFVGKARQIMSQQNITQISGAQVKIPMGLRNDVLKTSENDVFTHILKLPVDARMRALPLYEWFGMTLVRAGGVEVPAFRLVPLQQAEDAVSGLNIPMEWPVMGGQVSNIQSASEMRETPDEQIRRLSKELASQEQTEGFMAPGAWDEMCRLAAEGAGEVFQPLSDQTLTRRPPPAYLVERFDIPRPDDPRWRLAEDFCSLTGRLSDTTPDAKYAGTCEELAETLRAYSTDWEQDSRRLFRQVVGNVLVCNTDAHLKNYSILRIASRDRSRIEDVRLSPAYDVTVTAALTHGPGTQALTMYGERCPDREVLIHYGIEACALPPAEAAAVINQMACVIREEVPRALKKVPVWVRNDPQLWEGIRQAAEYVHEVCSRYASKQLRRALVQGRAGGGGPAP